MEAILQREQFSLIWQAVTVGQTVQLIFFSRICFFDFYGEFSLKIDETICPY